MQELSIQAVQRAVNLHLWNNRDKLKNSSVYMEDVEQNLNPPAIFVENITTAHIQELGNRRKRIHSFDIQFFPAESSKMRFEAYEVGEKLTLLLEKVPFLDGYMRGTNISIDYIGGILHCLVDFTVRGELEVESLPKMERLDQDREVVLYDEN